jgi:glycosyltransferase involved in cell wall biosynthesis
MGVSEVRPAREDPGGEQDVARAPEPARAPFVSVVIPTLNEATNIAWVLYRLPPVVDEVILVDGHSSDGTVAVARAARPDIVVVHAARRGKGAALRAGFAAARGTIVAMMDADCSMDPREIERLVARLRPGVDLVKGSRFMAGAGSADITRFRRLGNGALLGLVNRLYGVDFTDLCYGFIAFRRSALEALRIDAVGFEVETQIAVHALAANLRIEEVPSFEHPRHDGASKLRPCRDGLRVLWTIGRTHREMRRAARERARTHAPLPAAGGVVTAAAAIGTVRGDD